MWLIFLIGDTAKDLTFMQCSQGFVFLDPYLDLDIFAYLRAIFGISS